VAEERVERLCCYAEEKSDFHCVVVLIQTWVNGGGVLW